MPKTLFCSCGEPRSGEKCTRCKECQKASVAEYRNRQRVNGKIPSELYGYRTRKDNIENYIYQVAKQSAKKRGLDFNLDISDIVIPDVCPIFNTPFKNETRTGRNPRAPSIDRKDSTIGYVKGNVEIISWRANFLKSNGTAAEFKQLSEYLNAS